LHNHTEDTHNFSIVAEETTLVAV